MNIIIENASSGNRLQDGIDEILGLDSSKFESLLNELKRKNVYVNFYYAEERKKRRGDLGQPKETYSINKILEALKGRLIDLDPNSQEYKRISQILNSRNIDGFKAMCSKKNDASIVSAVFEILGDEGKFNRFINFGDNTEEFSIDGEEITQSEYLKCMATIFGMKDDVDSSFSGYDIPNQDIYIERYRELYDKVNLERYANPEYEFREMSFCKTIRCGDEPDWSVHPEVVQEVKLNMPEMLSPEERAIWIYLKLCQIFTYDEGYNYKDLIPDCKEKISSIHDFMQVGIEEEKIENVNYTTKFSKKHLESILPGTKITCFDFARIYFQLVNEGKEDIDAVIVPEGIFEKHFLNGIYNDRISATLDGVSNEVANDGMNDLMKVKSGIQIGGVKAIYDPNNIIGQAIAKLYPLIIGREPITTEVYIEKLKSRMESESHTTNLIEQLRTIPREGKNRDFKEELLMLLKVMQEQNVTGNEFFLMFANLRRYDFFGKQFQCALLGEKILSEKRYKRKICLKCINEDANKRKDNIVYLIDSDSLVLSEETIEEIEEKIENGEYVWENSDYIIESEEELCEC